MDPTDVETLIAEAGVEVTRVVRDEIYAHCPMPDRHSRGDNNPSWSINAETGVHFCFSCGYRGTLRQLIADLTGEVPRDLDYELTAASRRRHNTKVRERRERAVAKEVPEPEIFVSEYALQSYVEVPLTECDGRRLDPDLVDFYEVRWDDNQDYWIIPVRDFEGKLLGWQEKAKGHFKNVPFGMSKSKSLFGLKQFVGTTAVLVESPLDVIRMASVGIPGGVASYGANVSDEQMGELINTAMTVVLALDHDDAGRGSMLRLIDKYRKRSRLKIVRYRRDDPKDVGEMDASQIMRLLDRAVTPGLERVHR